MPQHAAALADEGHARLGILAPAQRLAREQHVQHHAVDIVGDAEAIRADDGEAAVARGLGDLVLHRLLADLGEACREDHRRADLAPRAGRDRLLHAGSRQREHREVDAFRQLVRALAAPDGRRSARRCGRPDGCRPRTC